ncbi:hypothetical protein [Streptomyces sp. NPDC007205]|uniref:hypothetical protein n=1 Tax=Streptomyces sp. NPDC007205 TaxID=3154316 RepID=UPI0033C97BDB
MTCADAPPGISGPTCYGPNLRAVATLLAAEGQIGTKSTVTLIAGLLDMEVSTGFVGRCLSRLDASLGRFEAELKQALRRSEVLGADESPISLAGERGYAYTVRATGLTRYGAAGTRLAGVRLCCAHLLRDPQGVIGNAPDQEHAAWATAAQRILREADRPSRRPTPPDTPRCTRANTPGSRRSS